MFNKKTGLAALAVGAAMALLPATAAARDRDDYRDDYRGGYNSGGRGYSHESHERWERRRDEGRERWERGRGGVSFGFSFGAPVRRYSVPIVVQPPAEGYYDQYGNWHPYGYYDQFGYWHQY